MKIAFASNYLNVHQQPLCHAFCDIIGYNEFKFIATTPFNELRLKSGYEDMNREQFVVRAYEDVNAAKCAVSEADVVIGLPYSTPDILKMRLDSSDRLTFAYSERLLKRGLWFRHLPPKRMRVRNAFTRYDQRKNFHILCASAFTSYDLSLFGFPVDRCWKWGYFPAVPESCTPRVASRSNPSLLWVGRLIRLKRPFAPLQLACRLAESGRSFHLTMVGDGEMRDELSSYIVDHNLSSYVTMTGAVPNAKVHRIMSESDIFLFTSKRDEGWGAVLSEAMANACVPVVSSAIGSVPYLVHNDANGKVFIDGDDEELYRCVVALMGDRDGLVRMGNKARETMTSLWNPRHAAESFVGLVDCLLAGKDPGIVEGPCSPAEVIPDSWFERADG